MNFKNYFKKENIQKQFTQKSFRIGGYSALASVVIIAIAVFVVLTVDSLSSKNTKIDMTSTNIYSLSEESVNIAKSVDKEVVIYYIVQNGTEDTYISNMLDKYAGYNKKIKIDIKDPVVNPNFAKNYTSENISNNSLIVTCGSKSRYIPYNDIYKTETDYSTYSQTTEYDGENQITSAINFVISDELPKMYQLTGHGEKPLSSGISSAIEKQNIETEDISLLSMESVPDDADVIILNNPTSDISEHERDLLLTYLKNGGKMFLLTGYTGTEMPVLNELMKNYGVAADNKLVVEGDKNKCLGGYNYYLLPDMESDTITDPLMNKKYYVLLPLAHDIIKVDGDTTADVKEILKTSNKAYTKTDAYNAESLDKTENDAEGQYTIGVSITDKNDDKETKIVWISSAQLLDDNVNQIVSGGNQDLFLNSVNWMCEREESIAIHAKSLQSENLAVTSGAITLWSLVFIFIIPVLFIAIGIYVKMRRKKN